MTDPTRPTEAPADYSDAALDREPVLSHQARHRLGWMLVAVLLVALLTVLPPLLNVSRYQRRVAQGISASIGRPVHFDAIHLHLLPLPGLTIQNFVVAEDPAFGQEPALRANTVEARLRLGSLWRRRVEVSRIELDSPSINLVRRADGRWNLQGVVTQAGYLQNAPTAQGSHGSAPRFPYIEATGARINVKAGEDKLPWSLVDARLALWLPEQNEWRVRLSGRPLRTDTDVSDVGELQLEGSLGRGPAGVSDQPITVSARWASTPLGETAKLFLGRDTGVRGAASAELELHGTPAHMQISTDLHLHNVRRAEFVPRLPMSVDAHCETGATGVVRQLRNLRCAVPTARSGGLFDGVFRSHEQRVTAAPGVLVLQADVPDLLHVASARATLDMADGRPEYFLGWVRVLSSRVPPAEAIGGAIRFHAGWNTAETPAGWVLRAECRCEISPALHSGTAPEAIPVSKDGSAGIKQGSPPDDAAASGGAEDVAATKSKETPWLIEATHLPGSDRASLSLSASQVMADTSAGNASPPASAGRDSLTAVPERTDPATTVTGIVDTHGASFTYPSLAIARYVATLLPPLGDNLPVAAAEAATGPVESQRSWNARQTWTTGTGGPATVRVRRQRH